MLGALKYRYLPFVCHQHCQSYLWWLCGFYLRGLACIRLRKRHVARQREIGRAGIGVFSEVTGAGWGLKNIDICPLFVAHSVNAMCGGYVAFVLRGWPVSACAGGMRLDKGKLAEPALGSSVR